MPKICKIIKFLFKKSLNYRWILCGLLLRWHWCYNGSGCCHSAHCCWSSIIQICHNGHWRCNWAWSSLKFTFQFYFIKFDLLDKNLFFVSSSNFQVTNNIFFWFSLNIFMSCYTHLRNMNSLQKFWLYLVVKQLNQELYYPFEDPLQVEYYPEVLWYCSTYSVWLFGY